MKKRYTMIELLIVMGIMAAIMGLMLPNFKRMAAGNSVNNAAKQLASAIAKTRTEAVISGRPVALLLPMQDGKQDSGNRIMPNFRNHAYSIAYLDDSKEKLDFTRVGKSGWSLLPEGALITCVSTDDELKTGGQWFDDNARKAQDTLREIKGFQDEVKEVNYGTNAVWHTAKVKEYRTQRTFDHAFIYARAGNKGTDYGGVGAGGGIYNFTPPKSIYGLVFNPDGSMDTPSVSIYIAEGIMVINTGLQQGTAESFEFASDSVATDCTMQPTNVDAAGVPAGAVRLDVNRFTGRVSVKEIAN